MAFAVGGFRGELLSALWTAAAKRRGLEEGRTASAQDTHRSLRLQSYPRGLAQLGCPLCSFQFSTLELLLSHLHVSGPDFSALASWHSLDHCRGLQAALQATQLQIAVTAATAGTLMFGRRKWSRSGAPRLSSSASAASLRRGSQIRLSKALK